MKGDTLLFAVAGTRCGIISAIFVKVQNSTFNLLKSRLYLIFNPFFSDKYNMSNENKNLKANSGLYVAVFFLCIVLIIMLFFVKKDTILSNLKKTNFFERVGVSTPEFVQKHEEKEVPAPAAEEEYEFDLMGETTKITQIKPAESSPADKNNEISVESDNPVDREIMQAVKNAESVKTNGYENERAVTVNTQDGGVQKPVSVPSTRNTNLCFVTIDSDGKVNRKIIVRALPKSDSPLTDAIKALIAGPLPGEPNCMNLIPSGTRLIGASVKNGVATLNFNENFEFNSYGIEGCMAQLMQIVYTATEFSTVKSVQFLVEGEKKDYLGTEGQWIGSPLSRASF